MSGPDLRHFVQVWATYTGNGYAIIERNGAGKPIALYPLLPENVIDAKYEDFRGHKILVYQVTIEKQKLRFLGEDLIHIKGLSKDGIFGISPIAYFVETLRLAKASEQAGGEYWEREGVPNGVLEIPGVVSGEDKEKILNDFKLSNFVVCTDAGLSSYVNREFNDITDKDAPNKRFFITTQSLKKLQEHLIDWSLDPKGWSIPNCPKVYDISDATDHEIIYYKERWINENGLSQRLIVTFSPKYRDYQRTIRANQINRAQKAIDKNKVDMPPQTSHKRLIERVYCTTKGEVAKNTSHSINKKLVEEESKYDGFYGVCTNMKEPVSRIIEINRQRWEIEESFMIMKSEFKARPVYLSRDDRIKAHFMTCFLTLLLYRVLEKKLDNKFTHRQIIDTLRDMNFNKVRGEGYIPMYTRTDLTDALHEKFGFRTDYQILKLEKLKNITTNSN